VRSRVSLSAGVVGLGVLLCAASFALAAPKAARPRGVNARTGRAVPPFSELVKANRKNDRAALERLAGRFGVARLAEGTRGPDVAVVEASLAAIPLARGGVALAGTVAERLDVSDPALATDAARALGLLLDADAPTELAEWEVPPDVVARACAGLRALAMHAPVAGPGSLASAVENARLAAVENARLAALENARLEALENARLAALDALAAAQVTCPPTGELAALVRDPAPAVRRAAALLLPPSDPRTRAALREGMGDPDPAVSAACVAAVCRRVEPPPPGHRPAADALIDQATGAARALVAVPATRPEDAVEMLTCVAAAATPADRALLERLRAGAASPVRDRAALLLAAGKPE
jgi:hypothetical protein